MAAVKDLEFWLGEVETLLASEDYGRDLASIENLLKKHQLLEVRKICRKFRKKICVTPRKLACHSKIGKHQENLSKTPEHRDKTLEVIRKAEKISYKTLNPLGPCP